MTASSRAMSARDLRDWLTGAQASLSDEGISCIHGIGPRLVEDGSTWISFSSRWGSGRLVRTVDGGSEIRARRYADGVTVVDSKAETTTERQLDTLTAALRRPLP